ncbi:exodeoxyribonuclease I [Pseudorhodoferax sp.]|uniref:exodeoxyribonuclease I n=1 Tax=Pseudorhodoferax sp. TaxID=1993553 RepID=UPI0039E5967A
MSHTFLWHDYETFGAVPRRDRPAQFAAIRTDADLNEIGEPMMWYCRPAPDYLPDPVSCLITGITPQHCLQHGLPEAEFAARIEQAFAQPGTIGVGYNTIRFDDEVTRFLFWRNLIDPYAREWQNGCGRWDLLDVVRLTHALRPDGIEWPQRPAEEGGGTSFRLEHLSAANGLAHAAAHDALSDVRATIALARLIKTRQPRLFDFALSLHRKDRVAAELRLPTTPREARPFLHVSGMFPVERGCLALMWPLAMHPTNRNELLAWDLAHDPRQLDGLSVDEARLRLYTRRDELPPGVSRLPLKSVHLNKSPMVVGNLKTLAPAMAARWSLDLDAQLRHAELAAALPDLSALWDGLLQREPRAALDVDEDLYGGFLGPADRRRLNQLRGLAPQALAGARSSFDDARLEELVFRYRARNFPDTLAEDEAERWQQHRFDRLIEGAGGARSVDQLLEELDRCGQDTDARGTAILEALHAYAEDIAADLA